MQKLRFFSIGFLLLTRIFSGSLAAQSWDFVREQDGIKVYTRQEAGKPLKAYRGTTTIQAPAEQIFTLIEDVNHTEWWDPNLTQIKVLVYEKFRRAQYYLIYDSPWPVSDRDLCVDVTVKIDPKRSVFMISAVPLTGVIPEKDDLVRIKNYRQAWTVTSAGDNSAEVVVEGYADPVGNIPDWISNKLIVQTPVNAILGVKKGIKK